MLVQGTGDKYDLSGHGWCMYGHKTFGALLTCVPYSPGSVGRLHYRSHSRGQHRVQHARGRLTMGLLELMQRFGMLGSSPVMVIF